MTGRRFRFLPRRMGQDVRAWPILALLIVVMVVAIGCVLWFMREAMRNERLAVRERLADAYRSHLALVRKTAEERWERWRLRLDAPENPPARFARWVRDGSVDAVICFDADGRIVYPQSVSGLNGIETHPTEEFQAELQELVKSGQKSAAVEFVRQKFASASPGSMRDAQGRFISANAELMALELLEDRSDARFRQLFERLVIRLNDYQSSTMPAGQRRFVMHELVRLLPDTKFATLSAEDLAAHYLEGQPVAPVTGILQRTEVPETWAVASPGNKTVALLKTETVRNRLNNAIHEYPVQSGVRVTLLAPNQDAVGDATLVTTALGTFMPGWRLSLSLADQALFATAANQKVTSYLFTAGIVIAAMTLLAMMVAGGFRREVQLARLKNDLVANVSHELKTPLTAMRALVETLLETEHPDETTTREYLQLLAKENARLSRLIENFLTFSRLARNKFVFTFAPVRPEVVLADAVAAFGERAHAPGCRVESHAGAGLPSIRGDSDALVTALLNLLDNAFKYSPDEKRIVARAEGENGSVRFAVSDNGIGLSPQETRRIFGRFYQTDRRLSREAGGCGLGLNIVQSIVEAHGGRIDVQSRPGEGSTFTMEIPAADNA